MSEIRVTDIKGEDGSAAVNFSKGINISSGVCTATSFSGSGANLTSLPAGQLTGALPAISGANLTGIVTGILQVKQVKTTAYITSGSSWTDITGLSITITPTAATTQMMLIPNVSSYHAANTQYAIKLVSSNSTIEYVIGDFWSPGSGVSGNITQFYLDDHNTTNAITYKVQHKHYSGSAGTNKDWSGNLNGVSTFTVIEIDSSVIS
tara:strand:- start:910 stop:1530 length:621 start_codon:yes stop_codon:yes gene_type:complete